MSGLLTKLFLLTCDRDLSDYQRADYDADYFTRGLAEAAEFCRTFPDGLPVAGKRVLDLGCGHGSLCLQLAERGAAEVVGFDPDVERIAFATRSLASRGAAARVRFAATAEAIGAQPFDIVVSKDTLEHVASPDDFLRDVAARLAGGGRFYAGFSPLWNSPFGGHGRLRTRLPWGHVLFPERVILDGLAQIYPDFRCDSIAAMGLNQMSFRQLNEVIARSGLRTRSLAANVPRYSLKNKLLTQLRRIPLLTEYCTHSVYFVLEKNVCAGETAP